MKLKNSSQSVPGGYYYVCEDGQTIRTDGNLRKLNIQVYDYLTANGLTIPDDLAEVIENQICDRVPSECWKGFGDRLAVAIHAVAGAIDKVAGTELQKAAKGCSGCGKRRRILNKL